MNGCLSYRILKRSVGEELALPGSRFQIGESMLTDALRIYGAPDRLISLQGKLLMIYERSVYYQNSLAFGIP
ncbi:MAG: hypothetical protein AB1659_01610, partial [Thermodesulfobacteriota bacterium]